MQFDYKSKINMHQSAQYFNSFMCLSTFQSKTSNISKHESLLENRSVTERAVCKFRQGRRIDRKKLGALAKSFIVPI